MSVCTFIASDKPLCEVMPQREYPFIINVDEGTIDDGGADDNFFLNIFKDVQSYTDKKYGVYLEWHYTEGRAKAILEYIKNALKHENTVELWHVWLMDYYEYDERPVIHRCTVSLTDMTIDDIKKIDSAEIWNEPDKRNPNRPSFYCLIIKQ